MKQDEETVETEESAEEQLSDEEIEEAAEAAHTKKRILKKKIRKQKSQSKAEKLSVMSEATGLEEETVDEEIAIPVETNNIVHDDDFETTDDDEDDEQDYDFELQRKLLKARKLYHRSRIQDVIKEGQIVLVQIVKEERGNKGAALTTYLSLAGRYCVLMPNRIKSGGVSRKITNATDRKRLKSIVRELPLTADMSIIVRTAGEEKTKSDIVRDYNYLIRSWNQIRLGALAAKSPALIYEEGNLIKRALRDIYTKDISEILVDGEIAFKTARDFFKILSPHNLKKIKHYRNNDIPLFQRFQVETQLDKLHEATAQLDSGGYLVINPTEALVAIDVNSGRATKEKDLEETALKTNLEACDEVARQLRMRNLAGLVVIDFIDMEEPANNHAVERRMKEALKKDRSRVQVGKMSCFGLLEISRQRMHSSFLESNYIVCPHCHGQGVVRTVESGAVLVLRGIEEEGIKNRSSQINVFVPTDVAIYLLNQKRATLVELEQKYNMNVVISADDSIKNISDYQIERIKMPKISSQDKKYADEIIIPENEAIVTQECDNIEISINNEAATEEENNFRKGRREKTRNRRDKGRRDRAPREKRDYKNETKETSSSDEKTNTKAEAIILYNSHGNTTSNADENKSEQEPVKEKSTWWKKLIKG
ncbi:MAG: Rne/Rng family ribonuclease [Alphaproteobacteria bacterium]|nr:Rne/Rng family ribonuclease [Alphaproteobacteria bacterium]